VAKAGVFGVSATAESGMPFAFDPDLFLSHEVGNLCILYPRQVPDYPADTVAVSLGLMVKVSLTQAVQCRLKRFQNTPVAINNQVLLLHICPSYLKN